MKKAPVVVFNLLCILTLCFSYSFSAFKLDLKKMMAWDETQISSVYMLATLGQNIAVHLGIFCDKFGSPGSFVLAAALKAAGLGGMYFCAMNKITNPYIFGFFFLLDTQGMSGGLIIAMKEVQRLAPPKYAGFAASCSKACFGFGAFYHTTLYDAYFQDVGNHFMSGGAQAVATLCICALTGPLLTPEKKKVENGDGKGKTAVKKEEKKEVAGRSKSPSAAKAKSEDKAKAPEDSAMTYIMTFEYLSIFMGMFVCWGCGMVWNANMASFATAAKLDNAKQIRGFFYTAKTVCSFAVGPLTDFTGVPLWYALTTLLMLAAGGVMLVSNGQAMTTAAIMAGGGFGSIATLIPVASKKLSYKNFGTLYALGKFAGCISGIGWNYYAAYNVQQQTQKGQANCVGDACYTSAWLVILGTSVPSTLIVLYWAISSMGQKKEKAE